MDVKSTWIPTWHQMDHFHGHFDYFQKSPLGGSPNTKPVDHGTPNAHDRWFIVFYHVWGPAWIEIHWNNIWLRAQSHMTFHITLEDPWLPYMILEVSWDGLWTISLGLSQFHGHGSWFVCEVALRWAMGTWLVLLQSSPQQPCSNLCNITS